MMYEDFVPERLAKLRALKGVSARDMSLSLGQANNYMHSRSDRTRTFAIRLSAASRSSELFEYRTVM